MKLRSRLCGSDAIIPTNFDAFAAFCRAVQEDEDRHRADGDDGDLSDAEAITAALSELALPPLPPRRLQTTNPPPSHHADRAASPMPSTFTVGHKRLRSSSMSTTYSPRHNSTDPAVMPDECASSSGSAKEQSTRNKRRRIKRQEKRAMGSLQPPMARTFSLVDGLKQESLKFSANAENFPAAGGGYTALPNRDKSRPRQESLEDLIKKKYQYIPWKGREPIAVTDGGKKVIVMLAGSPNTKDWDNSCTHVFNLMNAKGRELPAGKKYTEHVRGSFPAINVGVTHGKGSQTPHTLDHGPRIHRILYEIVEDRHMKRLATFQSAAFRTWSPKLYRHYEQYMDKLWSNEELNKKVSLRRNFAKSVFPCIALNFGPRVWTTSHRDTKNLPFGWCAITALGNFDPVKGGHLVLHDLKLVIEFPPNSTVFIPSATLVHANVPVSKTESRVSFTQFCAGDIFRFIDCGFQTEKQLAAMDPEKFTKHLERKKVNWENGLGLYSLVDELMADNLEDFEKHYDEYDDI